MGRELTAVGGSSRPERARGLSYYDATLGEPPQPPAPSPGLAELAHGVIQRLGDSHRSEWWAS